MPSFVSSDAMIRLSAALVIRIRLASSWVAAARTIARDSRTASGAQLAI